MDLSVFLKSNILGLHMYTSVTSFWANTQRSVSWIAYFYSFKIVKLLWVLACFSGACAVDASLL